MAKVKFFRGSKSSYDSASKHLDAVYFAQDTSEILMNGKVYGIDGTLAEKLKKSLVSVELSENGSIKFVDASDDEYTITIAPATQSQAGLMSAADKTKLDNIDGELQANLKYTSDLDDNLATVEKHGGIPAGTKVSDLEKKTLSQIFDDILFPTVNPEFVAPSATLSLKSTSTTPTIQEVGATGASVPTAASFNTSFSKGSITIAGVKKQDRSGELKPDDSFIYIGTPTVTDFPTTIPEGSITYKYRAAYEAGPQPLDSKGSNYGSPLAAGSVDSAAVTINGVYPYYTNKDNVSAFAKLSLTTATTLSAIKFVAETASAKHAFKLPKKYTVSKIELLNTLSGKYETYSVSKFTVTEEQIQVQGQNVDYKVYTRNDGTNGESTFNITFSK